MNVSLNGSWKVCHVPYRADITPMLQPDFVPEGWLTAQIPEDIHATLRRAGVIRGNTYNKREDEEAWIEQKDWVYCRAFIAPDELRGRRAHLLLEGLDTFCDLYLNGEPIGSHQNMFTPCEVDVSRLLRCGERNVLTVRFYSPTAFVEGRDDSDLFSITTSDRIFARKAQMNYSWDFCARCLTVGVWKDVSIVTRDEPRIESYYLHTDRLVPGAAEIGLEVALADVGEADDCRLEIALSQDGACVYRREGSPGEFAALTFTLDRPRLWWPRPYGEPYLYDFSLTLTRGGQPLDEKRQQFGVRTVEVLTEPQADGQSFQFAVNGKRLFIRGANWVPLNTVYTDIRPQDYEEMIHYAVCGNLSMLRIWGGGIYEPPVMFELCDRAGILLWCDFMLACGIYPQDGAFLREMAQEAEFVLKTYRNYACLALWSGDNENGQAYGWAGRPYEFDRDRISNVVLKEACARLDPHRYYLPTSPASPDPGAKGGDNPSSPYQGDLHLYIMSADRGVNANRDYGKDYYKRVLGFRPRFMSEFGFISLPEKESYYRFNFRREPLRNPAELIKFLPCARTYIEQGDMDHAIYYSQVFNAMALQYWIEYFRSLKGTCAGSLYWKFNDPLADCPDVWMYPSHMCAVDMYHLPKMTYYFTRRAYEDVVVVMTETPDGWDVSAVSELDRDLPGRLSVSRRAFSGETLQRVERDAVAKADAATLLCRVRRDELAPQNAFGEYIHVAFQTEKGTLENRYFFADLGEIDRLALDACELRVTSARRDGAEIRLALYAPYYARSVRVNILDCRADYSDNYFDMDAGTEKRVTIRLREPSGAEDAALYYEGANVRRTVLALASIPEAR